jgi:sterol desaturase/sphingolipid hydroxylase (fatty acid hydroxylase superfamily)
MENYQISNKGSGTIFKNPLLEKLTRTHFAFPVILYFSVGIFSIIYCAVFYHPSLLLIGILFLCGILIFTLVEYLIHRFVFHFNAETAKEKEIKYKIHGVHHHYPKDRDRLVMPPLLSIVLALIFFIFFRLLFNENGLLLFGGFSCGYSLYLIIHYCVHRYRQPKNFMSFLWKHHSLHHYRSDESAFAVSNPFWDYLFGTMPDKKNGNKNDMEKLPDSR